MRQTLLSTALITLAMTGAAQAKDLEITLTNKSDTNIVGFYLSPAGTDQWADNLVKGKLFSPEDVIKTAVKGGHTTCIYDIKVSLEDGAYIEDLALNLCETNGYNFTGSAGGEPMDDAVSEETTEANP